jgi:3-hydroxyisobutyrate dehydrogenase
MGAPSVSIIGLGQMGVPMVRNLLQAGFAVLGFDLNAKAMAQFSDASSFKPASSVAQVAQGSGSIILMLPTAASSMPCCGQKAPGWLRKCGRASC